MKDIVANAMSFHQDDGLHIRKTTLAAVLAWVGARLLTMADAAVWMGPATAVIVVQATLYRTLANGIRRVLAVTASVMIADLIVGSWNPAASTPTSGSRSRPVWRRPP